MALFVLGNGRSGTSALARVLSLCGGSLPPGLLGATSENPRGFFEARAVIHLNQAILHDHGSSGYDTALDAYQDGAFDVEKNGAWVAKLRDYLASLPPAPVLVIKEPKTTAVSAHLVRGRASGRLRRRGRGRGAPSGRDHRISGRSVPTSRITLTPRRSSPVPGG